MKISCLKILLLKRHKLGAALCCEYTQEHKMMPDLADGQLQLSTIPTGNNCTQPMPFRAPVNADGSSKVSKCHGKHRACRLIATQ